MDAAIASHYNTRDAQRIAKALDEKDAEARAVYTNSGNWFDTLAADLAASATSANENIRVILTLYAGEAIAHAPVGSIYFDGSPADDNWDELLREFQREIATRRA